MGRRAAKITHDEVTRLVKAVTACGLPVQRVVFDGERVDVVIGEPDKTEVDSKPDPKPKLEVVNL